MMDLGGSEASIGSPESFAAAIAASIEATILDLVVAAFDRWRAEGFTRVGEHEDHYTVRVVHFMQLLRRERNLMLQPRFQVVEPSEPMFLGAQDPAHAPRIDVTISWDLYSDDAYYSLECKRISPGALARLYVTEGILRFVNGFYAPGMSSAAMVGYVVGGTIDAVAQSVNTRIERNPPLGASDTLHAAQPVSGLASVFASHHTRTTSHDAFDLSHLWFEAAQMPALTGLVPAQSPRSRGSARRKSGAV